MMKKYYAVLLLALMPPAFAQDASGDADTGKQLYYDFACYGCHGYNATMRVPLVGDASGIMSNEPLFLNYLRLRADQNPTNPKNAMPNYSADTLSDKQARDIYAYIRSIDDDSPTVEDNPVMREILDAAKARGASDEK
jgi:mono/diheme cytochrome c family protein